MAGINGHNRRKNTGKRLENYRKKSITDGKNLEPGLVLFLLTVIKEIICCRFSTMGSVI